MKNRELIEKLLTFNPDDEAEVAVRCDTKEFPVAYVSPFSVHNGRLYISLPQGMHTVKRKA